MAHIVIENIFLICVYRESILYRQENFVSAYIEKSVDTRLILYNVETS